MEEKSTDSHTQIKVAKITAVQAVIVAVITTFGGITAGYFLSGGAKTASTGPQELDWSGRNESNKINVVKPNVTATNDSISIGELNAGRDVIFGNKQKQIIPNLQGESISSAEKILYEKNFNFTKEEKIVEMVIPGTVLKQEPLSGTKVNPDEVIIELVVAGNPVDPNLQYKLGEMFFTNKEKDISKAVFWFQKAAEQKHMKAQYALGIIYITGRDISTNVAKGFKWLHAAAEQGHHQAQYDLAKFYMEGLIVQRNFEEAGKWFQKVANHTHVKFTSKTAQSLAKQFVAASQGDRLAKFRIGSLYYFGDGIDQDFKQASMWYKLAANSGVAEAQFNLGVMYEAGKGLPRDKYKAFNWYEKSAKQGFAKAQHSLGRIYMKGQVVPQDIVLGAVWFNLAAAQGLEYGTRSRDMTQKTLTANQARRANRLAREYFEKYVTPFQN